MPVFTVAIAPERFQQLKHLADLERVSLGDTIAGFLDKAIAEKRLPDELPGWKIERIGSDVLIANPASGFAKLIPAGDAKVLGDEFLRFSQTSTRPSAILDIDTMTEIRRRGPGILIRDATSFVELVVAKNVAADIGRRIVKSAS